MHHLAFDYPAAEDAYDEAFACKVEPIVQIEATERLVTATKRPTELAPGLDYVAESYMITEHVFSGLLQVDADLNVMPALADNFRVSADGLSYLFQIRGSARWSDGVPVTAHDFVQTWNRTREMETVTAFLLEDVEHAEALDDHTLELRLREPRNYFLYVLAACPSYPWPTHLVAERGDDWHRAEPLVSNGPYVVESCDDEQLVLRANPQFDGPRGNIDARLHAVQADRCARYRRALGGRGAGRAQQRRAPADRRAHAGGGEPGAWHQHGRVPARGRACRHPRPAGADRAAGAADGEPGGRGDDGAAGPRWRAAAAGDARAPAHGAGADRHGARRRAAGRGRLPGRRRACPPCGWPRSTPCSRCWPASKT